jgi:hypothetical protein
MAGIKNDVMFVQVPLGMQNGEVVAYGLLQSAINMVREHFLEKMAKQSISGMVRANGEKSRIDKALES